MDLMERTMEKRSYDEGRRETTTNPPNPQPPSARSWKVVSDTSSQLESLMNIIDNSALTEKYKAWIYQHGILLRVLWHLLMFDVPLTSVKSQNQNSPCPEVQQHWFILHGSKDENTINVNRREIQSHQGQMTFWRCVTAMRPRYVKQGWISTGQEVASKCGNRQARNRNNTIDKMRHINRSGEGATCAERGSQD